MAQPLRSQRRDSRDVLFRFPGASSEARRTTVQKMGWSGVQNAELLRLVALGPMAGSGRLWLSLSRPSPCFPSRRRSPPFLVHSSVRDPTACARSSAAAMSYHESLGSLWLAELSQNGNRGLLASGWVGRDDPGEACWESVGGNTVSKVDELKAEIERLPSEDVAELFRWLAEKDWARWDKEIENDSQAGRLDFLMREAREEKAKGTLKDL